MSDSTQPNNQQTVIIALAVVAVLLAALVGVLIYQQSQAAKIAQLAVPAAQEPSAAQAPATGAPATTASGPFDAKTATKVPAGTTPEEFLTAYHKDVVAGKYDAAYKRLPLDRQQSYVNASSYAAQIKGYGISGYKLGKPVEKGDTMSIVGLMENPSMPISYTWNFKKVGSTWYVVSRAMGGSL